MLSCVSAALDGVSNRKRQKVNGMLFAVLLVFSPKGKDYHHARVFSLSLDAVFVQAPLCSSQSAGQLLEQTNRATFIYSRTAVVV